jgi:hypothetical protein
VNKNFKTIIQSHVIRYPQIQIEDLYKLAHQAAMGSEHAVKDIQSARDWLSNELINMGSISADPLFDEISPDGEILRIHLNPYIDHGGDTETLLQAFVRTANEYEGSLEKLKRYWTSVEQLADSSQINFQLDDLRNFIIKLDSKGYPAIHHSPKYENAYNPHYRVLARDYVHQLIAEMI